MENEPIFSSNTVPPTSPVMPSTPDPIQPPQPTPYVGAVPNSFRREQAQTPTPSFTNQNQPFITSQQSDNPELGPVPKMKIPGMLIAAIAGGAVLLAVGLFFLLRPSQNGSNTPKDPNAIITSAIIDNLQREEQSFTVSVEKNMDSDTPYSLSSDVFISKDKTIYIRTNDLNTYIKSAFSEASEDIINLIPTIDGVWWTLDSGTESDSLSSSFGLKIDGDDIDRAKILEVYKKHPYITATTIDDEKTYPTSGTVYGISINEDVLDAFEDELYELTNEHTDGVLLGTITIGSSNTSANSANFVLTINDSDPNHATLTGIYYEKSGYDARKDSISFEKDFSSAPSEAKDVSELIEAVNLAKESLIKTAMPQIQTAQDDTQRRMDYSVLSANITNYLTNNNGKFPPAGFLEATRFISSTGRDPDDTPYVIKVIPIDEYDPDDKPAISSGESTEVYVVTGATCGEDDTPVSASAKRAFAIYGALKSGTYCSSSV